MYIKHRGSQHIVNTRHVYIFQYFGINADMIRTLKFTFILILNILLSKELRKRRKEEKGQTDDRQEDRKKLFRNHFIIFQCSYSKASLDGNCDS